MIAGWSRGWRCSLRGVAVVEAFLSIFQRWFSARIGEGLIYDLRTRVYDHVQRQPIAFFTRTETGSLVSRLNNDVIGAQQAFTSTLSGAVSNVFSLIMVVGAMALLSWQLTLTALVLVPLFLVPAKYVGRRMQGLVREQMQGNAELGSTMTERFNVAGALLVKLYGRPADESRLFATRAGFVRDVSVRIAMVGRFFFTAMALTASLATALVYGSRWSARDLRAAHRRLTAGADRAARPALRTDHVAVEHSRRRDERVGELRAGLRGARPRALSGRAP